MKHLRRTWTFQESFACDQNETFQLDIWGLWSQTRHVNEGILSQRHLKGSALYFVPTKDIERLQKPQELSMGWNDCSSSIPAVTLHRGGGQGRMLMSAMLVIQKKEWLEIYCRFSSLSFKKKKRKKKKALKLYQKSLNVLPNSPKKAKWRKKSLY